ncbi:hypothetical protein DFH06DRAFT_630186 [Mycena polygramma]|nr:hypothetical protein DFH06DRAFT_630186 [Mycena polygramma]
MTIPHNGGQPWTLALSPGTGIDPRPQRTRLAEIDAEMADLQGRLVRLAAERKPLVEALRSVIYPILSLPSEITAEIFLQYFNRADIGGTDPNLPHAPGWIPPCGPLLLASVCRAWREIALALRPIWSKFHLIANDNAIPSTEKLFECWLPRTGNHPLDVDLRASDNLCATLAPYFHQLQAFSCSVDTPETFPNDLFRGRLPLLRKLDITFTMYEFDSVPSTAVTAFADAPQLREVLLADFTLPWIALPWGQLTHLELQGQSTTSCTEILHHTSRLETLVVDFVTNDSMQLAPARLEHLHTLKFHKYQTDIDILDHLILPALTHLEFTMPSRLPLALENPMVAHFTAFITRSACSLRSMTIMAPTDLGATIACLRATPTVSTVRLTDIEWNSLGFLRVLRESDFLPNVRSLSFNPCVHAIEIPYEELARLLASRWQGRGNGTARLESFELVMAGNVYLDPIPTVAQLEDGLRALRTLEADGLKIKIRTPQILSAGVDAVAVCPPSD